MAKDYFQDIVPPGRDDVPMDVGRPEPPPDRSIRKVNIQRPRPPMGDVRPPGPPVPPRSFTPAPRAPRGTRRWLWVLCGACVVALALLLLLFVFRTTSVTVVPQSQTVAFDQSAQFTAYPAASAGSGTIPYTVESSDFEDSEPVASNGMQHVDTKASGSFTVVNNYSASPVKLVKNTRFQSAGGLIFRVPADVSVPGKKDTVPGKVTVTVVADATGAQYNIGPQTRLTVPGLKSSPTEYANVYAYSTAPTAGGFSGEQAAVSPTDLAATVAKARARLQDKASAFADAQNSDTQTALSPRVTFTDMPNTTEAGNTVRIHESAHVQVLVVPAGVFASAVAQAVAANADTGAVKLVPGEGFAAAIPDAGANWGSDPITFGLSGHAQLVWIVDTKALAQALAGRQSAAFQTIVSNFPGVQSAHARVEPFWESSFPQNPSDIHISVEAPKMAK